MDGQKLPLGRTKLKYTYSENQWSPLNPDGKKQYNREFLVQLQCAPISLIKPHNLPNLDIIKDKPHLQKIFEINVTSTLFSTVNSASRCVSSFKLKEKLSEMAHFQNNGEVSTTPTNNSLSCTPKKLYATVEMSETEQLKRCIQAILNKIFHLKFEMFLAQLKSLNLNTEEKLGILVSGIFNQAVFDELNYIGLYVNICQHLKLMKVFQNEKRKFVTFHKLILNKCQEEFENEDSTNKTGDKSFSLQNICYGKFKMKQRKMGTVRFIGELYKKGLLIEPIMHDYIKKLLTKEDADSLECLCCLLKTVGKKLENKKNKNSKKSWTNYFIQIKGIINKRSVAARIRFMLEDVLDLTQNNWIPKNREEEDSESQPVPANEIIAELEPRHSKKNSTAQNIIISREKLISSLNSSKNCEITENYKNLPEAEKIETTALSSENPLKIIENPLKIIERDKNKKTDKSILVTRSAALSQGSNLNNSTPNPSDSKTSSSQSLESKNTNKDSVVDVPDNKIKETDTKKYFESQIKIKRTECTELRLKGAAELEENEMETKTKTLIDGFLHNSDFEGTIKCITELASPCTIHMFINSSFNQVLDKSSFARQSLGQLLFLLISQKIVSLDQFRAGLVKFLESVEDYFSLEISLIWDYIGEIVESMLENDKNSFSVLKDLMESFIPSVKAGRLVSATLHCAAKKRGILKTARLWINSGLQWTDFLGKEVNVDEFILKNKLEFVAPSIKSKENASNLTEELKKQLFGLIKKNEEIENSSKEKKSFFHATQPTVQSHQFPQTINGFLPNVPYQISCNGQPQAPVVLNPVTQQPVFQYNPMQILPPFLLPPKPPQMYQPIYYSPFQNQSISVPTGQAFVNSHPGSYNSSALTKAYNFLPQTTHLSHQIPQIEVEKTQLGINLDSKTINLKPEGNKKDGNNPEKKLKQSSAKNIKVLDFKDTRFNDVHSNIDDKLKDCNLHNNLPDEKTTDVTETLVKFSKPGSLLETESNLNNTREFSDDNSDIEQSSESDSTETVIDAQRFVTSSDINIDKNKTQKHVNNPESTFALSKKSKGKLKKISKSRRQMCKTKRNNLCCKNLKILVKESRKSNVIKQEMLREQKRSNNLMGKLLEMLTKISN